MLILRAMREIEASNIHTSMYQLLKTFFTIRSWTDGTNDFCASHASSFIHQNRPGAGQRQEKTL
jgi:hypothetical protein